jgi:NAD(P)-dependent dehydrogenase (short-subunit alcohol dehydrogenase family)
MRRLIEGCVERFGGLDIVVNNACARTGLLADQRLTTTDASCATSSRSTAARSTPH